MTRGALIFAFNNDHTDYVRMAAWCADNVRQHLGIPVAVVTNAVDHPLIGSFDKVIVAQAQSGGGRWFQDYGAHVTWYNAGRVDAYSLTPWEHTLVLDSDFVVNTDQMSSLFETKTDFLCHRHSLDFTQPTQKLLPSFGRWQLPMYWATVMVFRRSNTAQYIFDAMTMIRHNWQHYQDLYGISETNYRNDYALSIALAIVNGHTDQVDSIPWDMLATLPEHKLNMHMLDNNQYWTVNYRDTENRNKTMSFAGIDFHAMGKRSLLEAIDNG